MIEQIAAQTAFLKRVKVASGDDCWLWQGVLNKKGYGRYYTRGKVFFAHRVSYELFKGEIPPGLLVLHRCDVPTCVNPNHLFVGTHSDNAKDAVAKGRSGAQKYGSLNLMVDSHKITGL
jgi:hypothetical protein